MSALFIMIVVSLLVALLFLGAFIWAVRNGQYEDDYTPSVRMLFDDAHPAPNPPSTNPPSTNPPNQS
jgi:cbb3-type cytochrome oxidase maturation protein